MKVIKKNIAIITALCVVFTLSIPVNAKAASVSDISDHWANTTIQSWIENDLISGYPDGSFKPDNNITRAEFMTLVNKAFGFTSQAAISFPDVTADAWYFPAVKEALAAGYISGYPDGTMKPDNPITREEVASIISKIKMLKDNAEAANDFSDAMLMTWSKGAIGSIAEANIMNGYPSGSFIPQNYIKRGEAVVSLDRASKYVNLPPAPSIIGDDDKDTVTGLTSMMEYKLDSLDWVTYDTTTFNKLSFSGNHTLLVRFLATDSMPFSQTTTLIFTEEVPLAGSRSSNNSSPAPNPVVISVTGVTLDKNVITLTAGGVTDAITETVIPSNATNKTVTWMSSNINVATVSGGAVTPVAWGTAIITATTSEGGFSAICTVTVNPAPISVTGVTLDRTVMTLTTGGVTGTITATVNPTNATNKTATWTSSNISVATVSGGAVTPVAPGTAIITATTADGGFTATCTVTVNPAPISVTGVTLDRTVMTLTAGGVTGTITATVNPTNAANKTVTWTSSNISVATVSGGAVTPVASGTAIITATTADGGFTATCTVTVAYSAANPTVIFSRARISENQAYFLNLGYSSVDIGNIERVLWGEPGDAATYAGVYVESGVYSFTSDGALLINADNITQSLLDWLHHGVWTAGRMAIEITSSNGQGFYFNDNTGTINNSGGTALVMMTATDDNFKGTIIRVDLDDLESNPNLGTILMADGSTARFEVRVIGSLTPPTSITIGALSSTILVSETLQMFATFSPSGAYNQTITWVVDNVDPNVAVAAIVNSFPRTDIPGGLPLGTLVPLRSGTVTVTAFLNDNPTIRSNPYVVTIQDPFVPVTSITGVAATGDVGLPLNLSGTVNPNNATNDTIIWSIVSGSATIVGNQVTATQAGVVVVRATITNGAASSTNYNQDFTIIFINNVRQSQSDLELVPELQLNSEPQTQLEPQSEPELQLQSEPEPQLKPETEPALEPEPETNL